MKPTTIATTTKTTAQNLTADRAAIVADVKAEIAADAAELPEGITPEFAALVAVAAGTATEEQHKLAAGEIEADRAERERKKILRDAKRNLAMLSTEFLTLINEFIAAAVAHTAEMSSEEADRLAADFIGEYADGSALSLSVYSRNHVHGFKMSAVDGFGDLIKTRMFTHDDNVHDFDLDEVEF